MTVVVRLPTVLRPHAGGKPSATVEGATIGEVLRNLARAFPGLDSQVIGDDGALRRFVNVYVNDDDVRYLQQLETKVGDGDVVSILPAVAGGAG